MSQTGILPSGGTVARGFEGVRSAFLAAQGGDAGGAQLSVYRNGAPIVDLWAGCDREQQRPYGETTITVLMSCTKGLVAGALHMLAERGLIDFDQPASRYWPQFGQAGKQRITVRQLVSHAGGLVGYEPEAGMGAAEIFDWERSVAALERMAPLWPPGEGALYHFVTFGTLAGELIRRVDGRTVGRFVAEEIAAPLGLDVWIGLPQQHEPRRAPHFHEGPTLAAGEWRGILAGLGIDVESRLARTYLSTITAVEGALALLNVSRAARAAELPAGNGIGDARALARFYAALIGEVDGVRLLGPAAMEQARAAQPGTRRPPAEFAAMAREGGQAFGLGFELASPMRPMLGPASFGHSGAGGRLGFAHPPSGVAVGYACNAMRADLAGPDQRWLGWTAALREALGL
ncbi:MAG TPA: serine hydrolase domain-containing protein [Caulobacteraceae bacterium]|nr:serine hydrolase domain-containing protein [Caulobacteraceae bacterium]